MSSSFFWMKAKFPGIPKDTISPEEPCNICLSLLGQYRQVNERTGWLHPFSWSIALSSDLSTASVLITFALSIYARFSAAIS